MSPAPHIPPHILTPPCLDVMVFSTSGTNRPFSQSSIQSEMNDHMWLDESMLYYVGNMKSENTREHSEF